MWSRAGPVLSRPTPSSILFNNAGINIRKPPQDLALDEWTSVLDTNLTSAFLMARAVYPVMKRSGGGKIINTGSMTSIFGSSFAAAYASSKGGDRPAHQEPGAGLARRQHPGQCHPAGVVRYRADDAGTAGNPRAA